MIQSLPFPNYIITVYFSKSAMGIYYSIGHTVIAQTSEVSWTWTTV